jgi:hypothetical protein
MSTSGRISGFFRLVPAAAVLAAAGCAADTNHLVDPELEANNAGRASRVPVIYFDGTGIVEGASSSLVRTPNGVNYSLSTNDLVPGNAYTLWIVIFNNTDGCSAGAGGTFCGPDDVLNDDARPDMMYAGGLVVGASGKATFSGRRTVGDMSGSANGPIDDFPAYGLENPMGAEIHLVVHEHGPMLPAYMPDMIQTIDGGCFDAGVPGPGIPFGWNLYDGEPGVGAFGRRGPNTCTSVQATAHVPAAP